MWLRCVCGLSLRAAMSSIIRRRSGLTVLVSLMGRSFLSEVERPSILRTGLPVAPSLFYRLATGLSAPAPAQRAGAQRLRALARPSRSAIDRNLAHCSRSSRPANGECPPEADVDRRPNRVYGCRKVDGEWVFISHLSVDVTE